MGIGRTQDEDNGRREFEEFRQTLVAFAALETSKENGEFKGLSSQSADFDLEHNKLVCVTSGVSFLGVALVKRLLLHGYSVRILVDNQGKKKHKLNFKLSKTLVRFQVLV